MVSLAALLVLAIFALYPGPPNPTVNVSTAVRASTDHRVHVRELKRRANSSGNHRESDKSWPWRAAPPWSMTGLPG
jgi:hypothetical protein